MLTLNITSIFFKIPLHISNVLLPFLKFNDSVINLVSVHFRGKKARLMSCYAFFKRWLLPSLLYNCHHFITLFPLNLQLKTLSINLGCLPLDTRPQRLVSDSIKLFQRIHSFLKLSKAIAPLILKELYPIEFNLQAILKYISQKTGYH